MSPTSFVTGQEVKLQLWRKADGWRWEGVQLSTPLTDTKAAGVKFNQERWGTKAETGVGDMQAMMEQQEVRWEVLNSNIYQRKR